MAALSIREAATRLGVTPQTVRKRVHGGDLPAELVQGKYGPEWQVSLEERRPPRDPRAPLNDLAHVIAHQERIIRRLEARLSLLSRRIQWRDNDERPNCG